MGWSRETEGNRIQGTGAGSPLRTGNELTWDGEQARVPGPLEGGTGTFRCWWLGGGRTRRLETVQAADLGTLWPESGAGSTPWCGL